MVLFGWKWKKDGVLIPKWNALLIIIWSAFTITDFIIKGWK